MLYLIEIRTELYVEGTRRVQTHAVLLLTLTVTLNFDLSTQNHVSCIGYPKIIPYTKFEHFGIIRFRVKPGFQTRLCASDRQTDGFEHATHVDRQSRRAWVITAVKRRHWR